jgi:hypothetical protein
VNLSDLRTAPAHAQLLRDFLMNDQIVRHLEAKAASLSPISFWLRLDECLKFLLLSAKIGSGPVPMSREIDDIWHAYILETREYALLCERIGAFVHHSAIERPASVDRQQQHETELLFAVGYVANFGPFVAEVMPLWPLVAELMNYLHLDLAGLNAYVRSLSEQASPLQLLL